MKRLLKLSGFVVLVTAINVVTILVLVGPMITGAGPGCPVGPGPEAECNGDVNGDGILNVADAVYTLNYLFVDGSLAPVAIASGGLTPEQEEWRDSLASPVGGETISPHLVSKEEL